MNLEEIEKALARGVEILASFLPTKSPLVFPILSSACVWAVRRVFNYRDHLMTWQVWLDLDMIRTKPDDFVLYFFQNHESLKKVYEDEIRAKDIQALRKDFPALYPVCGLEDAFLKAVFREALAAGNFRKIAADFQDVVSRAKEDIKAAEQNRDFWKFLETFGIEIAALGIHLLSDEAIQDLILEAVRKRAEEGASIETSD
jgi:hypothetical protein